MTRVRSHLDHRLAGGLGGGGGGVIGGSMASGAVSFDDRIASTNDCASAAGAFAAAAVPGVGRKHGDRPRKAAAAIARSARRLDDKSAARLSLLVCFFMV